MEQTVRDLSKLTKEQKVIRLTAINRYRQSLDALEKQLIPLLSQVWSLKERKKTIKAELEKAYNMFQ